MLPVALEGTPRSQTHSDPATRPGPCRYQSSPHPTAQRFSSTTSISRGSQSPLMHELTLT